MGLAILKDETFQHSAAERSTDAIPNQISMGKLIKFPPSMAHGVGMAAKER